MTNEPEPITDQQMDAYLDGLLTPEERMAFEARLRNHPELLGEIELQEQIDTGLRRLFPTEQLPQRELTKILEPDLQETSPLAQRPEGAASAEGRRWTATVAAALIGLAALFGWVVFGWLYGGDSPDSVFFESRPLAMVYQEAVDSGFEPYYDCDEDERFRATFLRRQGQELTLAALPKGSRMLGLAYPGGLSRDTTAMLCYVDDQPVMVFVDRVEADSALAGWNESKQIHVFREERNGLVFYEVTPFDSPHLIEHLVSP